MSIFKSLCEAFSKDLSNSSYYFVGGKYSEWANNDSNIITTETQELEAEFRSELLFAKKIHPENYSFLIEKNQWVANTKYEYYTPEGNPSSYYVLTSANSVYKCLDNANTTSTVEPNILSPYPFITGDGYKWIYLYSIPNMEAYSNSTHMSVFANTIISNSAIGGTIDKIDVIASGTGYKTYSGSLIAVSNTTYKISDSIITDSSINGYGLYVKSGVKNGSVFEISTNFSNSSGSYITTSIASNLISNTLYRINPILSIVGDGTSCQAEAVVNSISSGIESVFILNRGSNYTFANVNISTSYSSNIAEFSAIISNVNGHGFDPVSELNTNICEFKVEVADDYISQLLEYRIVGIIKNPKQYSSNTICTDEYLRGYHEFVVSNTLGTFATGDIITNSNSAYAEVITANSTHILCNVKESEFAISDLITSGSNTAIISEINNPDMDKRTGEVLVLNSHEKINRADYYSEELSFILTRE